MKVLLNIPNLAKMDLGVEENFHFNRTSTNKIPLARSGMKVKNSQKISFFGSGGFFDNQETIPVKQQDLSKLFVKYQGTPSTFDAKQYQLQDESQFFPTFSTPSYTKNDTEEETFGEGRLAGFKIYENKTYNNPIGATIPGTVSTYSDDPITSANSSDVASRYSSIIQPYLGMRFQLGGDGKTSIDCSGFTRAIGKQLGLNINGTAKTQYEQSQHIDVGQVKPGDLVFLQDTQPKARKHGEGSHVAFVVDSSNVGNGKITVAEASSSKGQVIYRTWDLNSDYYKKHFLGAGRPYNVHNTQQSSS